MPFRHNKQHESTPTFIFNIGNKIASMHVHIPTRINANARTWNYVYTRMYIHISTYSSDTIAHIVNYHRTRFFSSSCKCSYCVCLYSVFRFPHYELAGKINRIRIRIQYQFPPQIFHALKNIAESVFANARQSWRFNYNVCKNFQQ